MLYRTALNAALNSTGTVVSMISGLLIMPFLIINLGAERYGLWTLITGLSGYFGFIDLGVGASVGRLIAASRGQETVQSINHIVSTAFIILLAIFLLACLATAGAIVAFFYLFHVPLEQVADVKLALWLIGINIALSFPLSVFRSILWGYERFDLLNYIDIPITIARTLAILLLINKSSSLSLLATITIIPILITYAIQIIICLKIIPNFRISIKYLQRALVPEIYSFGIWFFLLSLSRNLIPQIAPTIIGSLMGSSSVTTFAVARQLLMYTNIFLINATQVLAPRANILNEEGSHAKQLALLIRGGRYALGLSLYFIMGLIALGFSFIHLWLHGHQDDAYYLLLILLAGEILPMSQWISYSVTLGIRKHHFLAVFALAEGAATVVLCALLIPNYGLLGASIAIAIPSLLFRGLGQLLLICRFMKLSVLSYLNQVFTPVLLAALVPSLLILLFDYLHPQGNWMQIVFAGSLYSALFAVFVVPIIIGKEHLQSLITYFRHFSKGALNVFKEKH